MALVEMAARCRQTSGTPSATAALTADASATLNSSGNSVASGKLDARAAVRCRPTKPAAPVMRMRRGAVGMSGPLPRPMPGEIGLDHFGDHLLQRNEWRPTERLSRLRGVTEQHVDLSRTQQILSGDDVVFVIETGVRECQAAEFPNRGVGSGCHHIIIRPVL